MKNKSKGSRSISHTVSRQISSICLSDHVEDIRFSRKRPEINNYKVSSGFAEAHDKSSQRRSLYQILSIDYKLSDIYGYKCANLINEDGIYEVFEPAKIELRNIPRVDPDPSEGFSGFEDSSGEEENHIKDDIIAKPKNVRKSLEKQLNTKSRYKLRLIKKAPSESTEKLKNEFDNDNSLIKHAQTEEHGINDILIIKSQCVREVSPKSNISSYSNTRSPIAVLGKYRWANNKARKQSLDSRISSKTGLKNESNSFDESESNNSSERNKKYKNESKLIDEFEVDDNRRLRRISTKISESLIPIKVIKNLKFIKFLRRTQVLKKTLLGRILKVTQRNLSKIKYVEDDQLFNNNSNIVRVEEIKQVANNNQTSSEEDWSHPDLNIEEMKDTIDLKEKLPTHQNPNIYFKHLDTMHGERKSKARKDEDSKSRDHHLLLPLAKDEFNRMDSGGSSADGAGFESVQNKSVANLIPKNSFERRNTPGINYSNKLVPNEAKVK